MSGGHNVSEETIRRRYFRGLKNFFEIYQPLADSWTVYNTSAAAQIELIAKHSQSTAKIFNERIWGKICGLAE
ncbi:MAG: hypothetical protein ACR2GD_05895 [Pyrinomonadaceae bacterium]